MKIFLVRHGETNFNKLDLHQHPDVGLSDLGKQQAEQVGERLEGYEFTHCYCSDYYRAKETASIIHSHNYVKIVYQDMFREWAYPTEIQGKAIHGKEILKFKDKLHKNREKDHEYQHSDELSFSKFSSKLEQAKIQFENHDANDQILIISHGGFISSLMGYIFTGSEWNYNNYLKFKSFFYLKNTGITILEYTNKWKLITWNDHAHL